MIFQEAKLLGVYIIEPKKISDDRGSFFRSFCQDEFKNYHLNPNIAQCNLSFNHTKGTVRGMHFQRYPKAETKLVRCIRGSIYDVVIDLRPQSSTYCKWISVELTANNYQMLYVPEGFAHGFQTLEDNTEVFYQMSESYFPEYSAGVRWDDLAFDIKFPLEITSISQKDQTYPDFIK
jgi:dTDP-4-dehydrorhamnose 3,5-epimerase